MRKSERSIEIGKSSKKNDQNISWTSAKLIYLVAFNKKTHTEMYALSEYTMQHKWVTEKGHLLLEASKMLIFIMFTIFNLLLAVLQICFIAVKFV